MTLTATRHAGLAAATVLLLLTAPAPGAAPTTRTRSRRRRRPCAAGDHTGREGDGWTVLHYSMGDTNLEPFMVADVNELGEVGSNDNLQIREFMDRSAEYGEDPLLDQGDWVGGRVLDIGAGGTTELVEDIGDVNSADPAVLASFIAEGIEAAPRRPLRADHLRPRRLLAGHRPRRGHRDYDVLDLAEITDAISTGLEQAGVDKLDLLGFDACLMANYEVASAVAPLADRLVASQELEPGHGWDYRSLQVLADDPDATADELGAEIIAGFEGQAEEQGTQDQITLSMIDLTKMDAVDEAVDDFAETMGEQSGDVAPAVGQSEATTLAFGKSPDESQDKHLSDLGLLAASIGESAPEVAELADARRRRARRRPSSTPSTASPPPAPPASRSTCRRSRSSRTRRTSTSSSSEPWAAFLDAYYGAGEAIPAERAAGVHRPRRPGRRSSSRTTAASPSTATFDPPASTTSPRRRSATRWSTTTTRSPTSARRSRTSPRTTASGGVGQLRPDRHWRSPTARTRRTPTSTST